MAATALAPGWFYRAEFPPPVETRTGAGEEQ